VEDKIVVLKFGSSVLRTPADLPSAAHEIYRWYRDGNRVIAVVSAIGDTTNELLGAGRELISSPEPYALAELLATGERESAALLGIALDRVGIRARVVDPREIGLLAVGSVLDSEPVNVNRERLVTFLAESPVLVVPGFFGFDEKQRLHLLGRGGSDLTATFLAGAIGATRCRLLKDVDGVYESDPASAGPSRPRRFASLTYADALESAGPLIQSKAVHFLERRQGTAEVAALACGYESHVGLGITTAAEVFVAPPTRVLLLGLGTVGGGVYRRLAAMPEQFQVVGALVRSDSRYSAEGIPEALLKTDVAHLHQLDSDVVVDALPGVEPASRLTSTFLADGIDVVTANKAVIAQSGAELIALAARHGASLRYSAAVGGSAPMIETVRRVAKTNDIASISAILSGTCNFVLEQFEQGVPLHEAVRDAQQRGYAEADASEDLSGRDSARKLRILARHAFGREVDAMLVVGITEDSLRKLMAEARGKEKLRLIGTTRLDGGQVQGHVRLDWIGENHALASTGGDWNSLAITLTGGETIVVTGRGAGRWPTTEAVIADLLESRRERLGRGSRNNASRQLQERGLFGSVNVPL
jgi:homoserine dehydrogenase